MSTEVTTTRPMDPLLQILDFIREGKTDAATVEKLVGLVERAEDRKAAQRFGEAIAAFQADCPAIPRNESFSVTGGNPIYYASFDETMALAGPVMAKHGISATWSIDHWEPEGNRISGKCRVQVGAHFVDHEFKGVPIPQLKLSGTQAYGAAMSYFRRYSLEASLGMRRTGEDKEANLLDTLLQPEVDELRALVRAKGRDDAAVLKAWKVEQFDHILRDEFKAVMTFVGKLTPKGRAE